MLRELFFHGEVFVIYLLQVWSPDDAFSPPLIRAALSGLHLVLISVLTTS